MPMKKHFIILAAVSVGLVLMSSQGNVQAQEKEVEEKKTTEEEKPNSLEQKGLNHVGQAL